MRLILASHVFALGGTESYMLTVAEHLERLGHEPVLHADLTGAMADEAAARDLRLVVDPSDLPDRCDAVLSQDAAMCHALAERYPSAPQLFIAHSPVHDLQLPPQLPGLVGKAVAMSELVAARLRALAVAPEVVRLRQPIDTARYAPLEAIRERPRRAVLIGTYLRGRRRELLAGAWPGIEVVGTNGSGAAALADADIVIGRGRVILEGMARGRAAYVLNQGGADGWVTADSYAALEANAFAGMATDTRSSEAAIQAELGRYSPDMGIVNRDLTLAHHDAKRHVQQLLEVIPTLRPPAPADGAPLAEMARLVRLQWRAELLATERLAMAQSLQERIAELEAAVAREAAYSAELKATRRWRAAAALGGVADRLRGRS